MKLKPNRIQKVLLASALLFLVLTGWAQNTIDMSEMVLKLSQPVMFHEMGDKGFAVFDEGDEKIKCFNWDFKCTLQMPVKKGEGPGEAKGNIGSMAWVKDRIYWNCFFDYKIKIFKPDGIFEREVPIGFQPRKMIYRKNRLYAFKMNINPDADTFSPGFIMDPLSLKTLSAITVNAKLFDPKLYMGQGIMLGMSSFYDMDESGNIYVLNGTANRLIQIGPNNKLIRNLELPYKDRKNVWKNSDNVVNISQLDYYQDIRVLKSGMYICFLKTIKENRAEKTRVYQTVVMKISEKGKPLEKSIDGNYVIIGQWKDKVYLFETEEYKVVPVKCSEWK
ncbi:MAG: hypothetical protein ACM3SY_10550 [Candidatus Omnitrophota bacterium]